MIGDGAVRYRFDQGLDRYVPVEAAPVTDNIGSNTYSFKLPNLEPADWYEPAASARAAQTWERCGDGWIFRQPLTPEPTTIPVPGRPWKRRPTRSESFMDRAYGASERATCDRAHVGVAIVQDGHVVVDGYNGALAGEPHCDDAGHDMEDGHCVRSVHAEANAVAFAAKYGIRLVSSAAYVTHYPCFPCLKLLLSAGVWAVYYDQAYRTDSRVADVCAARDIPLVHYSKGPQ